MVLKIIAAGLAFVNGILIARMLGPSGYGAYSIILSLVNFAATLAVLGLPMLVTRETAAGSDQGHWGQLKGLVHTAHRWTLLSTLGLLAGAVVVFAGGLVRAEISFVAIAVACALVPLSAFNQLRASILRGLHWIVLADIPDLFLRPVLMLLVLSLAYMTASQINLATALTVQLSGVTIAFLAGSWWLRSRQPAQLRSASVVTLGKRQWLLEALPFLAITLVTMLGSQVSLYMLGYFGTAKQAGLFQVAAQLVGLVAIGLAAISMSLQPKVAAAWARGDKQEVQRLVAETARLGTAFASVGSLVILVFAEGLLILFGPQYAQAAGALRILAIGQMINAASGPCAVLLMMTGHQNIVMRGIALALVANAVFAYYAIPLFGPSGGALGAVLGVACWNYYFTVFSLNRLGINTSVVSLLKRKDQA